MLNWKDTVIFLIFDDTICQELLTPMVSNTRDENRWLILWGHGRMKIPTLLEEFHISSFFIFTKILLIIIILKHKTIRDDKSNL